jgi:hypothetical protein
VVDTTGSFTLGAVVRLADSGPTRPMTVLSQAGEHTDGCEVSHEPSTHAWHLVMPEKDEAELQRGSGAAWTAAPRFWASRSGARRHCLSEGAVAAFAPMFARSEPGVTSIPLFGRPLGRRQRGGPRWHRPIVSSRAASLLMTGGPESPWALADAPEPGERTAVRHHGTHMATAGTAGAEGAAVVAGVAGVAVRAVWRGEGAWKRWCQLR